MPAGALKPAVVVGQVDEGVAVRVDDGVLAAHDVAVRGGVGPEAVEGQQLAHGEQARVLDPVALQAGLLVVEALVGDDPAGDDLLAVGAVPGVGAVGGLDPLVLIGGLVRVAAIGDGGGLGALLGAGGLGVGGLLSVVGVLGVSAIGAGAVDDLGVGGVCVGVVGLLGVGVLLGAVGLLGVGVGGALVGASVRVGVVGGALAGDSVRVGVVGDRHDGRLLALAGILGFPALRGGGGDRLVGHQGGLDLVGDDDVGGHEHGAHAQRSHEPGEDAGVLVLEYHLRPPIQLNNVRYQRKTLNSSANKLQACVGCV